MSLEEMSCLEWQPMMLGRDLRLQHEQEILARKQALRKERNRRRKEFRTFASAFLMCGLMFLGLWATFVVAYII